IAAPSADAGRSMAGTIVARLQLNQLIGYMRRLHGRDENSARLVLEVAGADMEAPPTAAERSAGGTAKLLFTLADLELTPTLTPAAAAGPDRPGWSLVVLLGGLALTGGLAHAVRSAGPAPRAPPPPTPPQRGRRGRAG